MSDRYIYRGFYVVAEDIDTYSISPISEDVDCPDCCFSLYVSSWEAEREIDEVWSGM